MSQRTQIPRASPRHCNWHQPWHDILCTFLAKFILEVLGGGGAIWGFSEACGLRSQDTIWFWRPMALLTTLVFGLRWLWQLHGALLFLNNRYSPHMITTKQSMMQPPNAVIQLPTIDDDDLALEEHERTANAWSSSSVRPVCRATNSNDVLLPAEGILCGLSRREILRRGLTFLSSTLILGDNSTPPAHAYTPDPDPLKESLYLLCRVQEATLLQERYIQRKRPPISKMKLTLRLVERSYRIQDQVNFVSRYIPADNIVAATSAGNQAAESLQEAISFVYDFPVNNVEQQQQPMTSDQRSFLLQALQDTRQQITEFVTYLPDQTPLLAARTRVKEENKLNRDEFDPDLADEATGVYNPIELPWKSTTTTILKQ
ncbi:hypothetical protein IV203_011884 [Nitzschia inconspicua]|uniref:Uncharacterized protein n=1 Tax=Nitzschia inconspicua TaxID=303405 RepID=A0A9K3PIU2_9STRA|nr:hypothetical protein IV203_011884 [Nitzschia inconspicua]